jgi:hypothetical protein
MSIDRQAFVRFDTNHYSVPSQYAEHTLTLAVDDVVLRVLDGEAEVARHARSYGRNQVIEDPAHRAELVQQRRSAANLKGRDRLRAVCPRIDELIKHWVHDGRLIGPMCSRLVYVLDLYGESVFAAAVGDVLATGTTDFGALNIAGAAIAGVDLVADHELGLGTRWWCGCQFREATSDGAKIYGKGLPGSRFLAAAHGHSTASSPSIRIGSRSA